ncbi:MAG: glycosyltransferase, partial [Gemmatimonadota bacterium]|nr:glycosyltransferase [Gemmatimonadota bacterium]
MSETLPYLSVVVPVASRADDLADVYSVFSKAVAAVAPDYEFVFVFDGSATTPDESFLKLAQHDSRIRVYELSHTFGETGALRTGIAESRGEIILTLPAYFQVVPGAVAPLLAALVPDVDIVVTKREPRHDPRLNRLQTRVFHALVRWVTGTEFGDIACGVRALRRPAAELLPLYGDLHRFLPA